MLYMPTMPDFEEILGLKEVVRKLPSNTSTSQQKILRLLTQHQLPDHLLHHIACDYAEKLLQQVKEADIAGEQILWQVLKIKRLWIEGKASLQQLKKAFQEATTVKHFIGNTHQIFLEVQGHSDATDYSSGIKKSQQAYSAAEITCEASRFEVRYSDLSIAKNIIYNLFSNATPQQLQWLSWHLKEQLLRYEKLRSQLTSLLQERRTHRIYAKEKWLQQSEKILFEDL